MLALALAQAEQPLQSMDEGHLLGRWRRWCLDLALQLDECIHKLEHHRLDGGGLEEQHAAQRARMAQQLEERSRHLRVTVEGHPVHGALERRRELLTQHGARRRQQMRRYDREYERRTVGDHECEQRRNHRRLPLPHDELMAERLAAPVSLDEGLDKTHLGLAEQQVVRELEDEQSRVELDWAARRRPLAELDQVLRRPWLHPGHILHIVALGGERRGEHLGLRLCRAREALVRDGGAPPTLRGELAHDL